MQIIDGRKMRDEILGKLAKRVASLPFKPVFCDVLVGNDSASVQYVSMKEKCAENIGIGTHLARFSENISTEELLEEIKKISDIPHMSGLIVQLPLPKHIDEKKILNAIPKEIDVDAIGRESEKSFYENNPLYILPTAGAILSILDSLNLDISGKKVVVVGQGMLVGKPVTHLLRNRNVAVSVVDTQTENSQEIIANADVLISAVGKAGVVTGADLKSGVVVIDAGTSESSGAIAGDVDCAGIENIASVISPVPGGVGPVTVAMLMQNVVISAERKAFK